MKFEEKKTLGRLIRTHRLRFNWTQERLAGAADINVRTVQRAERGCGISSESLAPIAAALELDERQLRTEVATTSPTPEKRIPLKQIKSADNLIDVLELYARGGRSLEIGPPGEHKYNEMVGEDIIALSEDLEHAPKSSKGKSKQLQGVQFILSMCNQMGFGLFAGNYTEEVKIQNRSKQKKTTLIIAAPLTDPRIIRTGKGTELDAVRDSRRLLLGGMLSGHTTAYNWLEHQLIGGDEERVKDAFRRIMAEVMSEVKKAGSQTRSKNENI